MIRFPDDIELGRDTTRIKDQRDALRQKLTTERLLERFFHDDVSRQWELQLVADEVALEQKNQQLEQSQQFILSLLSAMSDVLVACDSDGAIEETNAALCELVGKTDDQLRGMPLARLLGDEVMSEFYDRDADGLPRRWLNRVRASLRTCGPAFSATRMLDDYIDQIYTPQPAPVG